MKEHKGKIALSVISVTVVVIVAVVLAIVAAQNEAFAERVVSLGYLGVVIAAYISGLDVVLPMPAVAFVPVFTAAGFALPVVIALMVVGTVLADLTSYLIGYYGRRVRTIQEAQWYARMQRMVHERKRLILPFVFVYASIVPLPNELIIVPLSLLGYRIRMLVLPLLLGTIVHITIFALGAEQLVSFISAWMGTE